MDNPDVYNTKPQVQQNERIETYKKHRRISWWINAIGWWTMGLGVLAWAAFKSKLWFSLGLAAGIGFIVAGIVYDIINKLYRCPYCGGFLFRKTKCMSCGKIVVVIHK